MKFLKKFFDDNSTIVGLCFFEQTKTKHYPNAAEGKFFFNPYQFENSWETKFETNVLL
jgi:hypothetical protein